VRRALFRLVIVIAVLAAGLAESGSASGLGSFPNIAGTWQVAAYQCPAICTDVWTVSPVSPGESSPSVYNITTQNGFYAKNVTITPNGGTAFKETCDGCTGYSLLKLTFHSNGGRNTFTGTWQGFNPRSNAPGAPLYPGGTAKETGYESTSAPGASISVSVSLASATTVVGSGAAATSPAGVPVGQTEDFAVTVTAGPDALSSVDLRDLTSQNVQVVAQPPGANDFSLAAGASRTFDVRIKGVAAGPADLSCTASGKAADGQSVQASATDDFSLTGPGLRITLATTPSQLKLEVNDSGEVVPGKVTVTVTFTNTTKATIDTAQLLLLAPEPVVRSQQLNQLTLGKGSLPVLIGPFPPSSHASRKFTLTVTGDGKYQWRALAIYNDASRAGGNGRAVGQGGQFTVKIPLLYFKATQQGTEVKAGGSWYVTGQVKNLSSFQTLCLSPLQPRFSDNAGGLGPHQIGVVPVDDPAPPFAGPLAPGQTILFLERVRTEALAPTAAGVLVGTSSGVVLAPQATLGAAGDGCKVEDIDQRAPVAMTDIKVAPGSRFFQVDVTPAPPSAVGAGTLEFFGAYAATSAAQIAQLLESGCSMVKKYGSVDNLVAAFGRGAQGLLDAQAAVSSLYHSAAMGAMFWYYADPAERDAFENQVVETFLQKGGRAWDGVQGTVKTDVDRWMDQLEQAYISGDWSSIFHALGATSADVVNEQAITIAGWELAIGAVSRVGAFGEVLQRYEASGLQSEFLTSLKTVPIGRLLNFEEMQRLWGLAYEDYQAFQKISEDYGVLIGVRGRSPITVENLADGAVWKHEELKPKNVSPIDVKYLGFDQQDNGLVAFRTYTLAERAKIESNIATLPQSLRDTVQARFDTRLGESQYVGTIEGFSKQGTIDVGFNYADNGVNRESTSKVRSFYLQQTDIADGGTYYRPYQENPALDYLAKDKGPLPLDASKCERRLIMLVMKLVCRVTGDMDGVYLTTPNNTALPEALRIEVYNALAAVGWQHPETLTWIKNGLFDFDKKTNILRALELGGEAMMEFAPDGIVRATYLALNASRFGTVNDYFVAVLGGYTSFLYRK
jgi:hypothetical protein